MITKPVDTGLNHPPQAPPVKVETLLAAAMVAVFLAALDQNIVGTALPQIARQLDGNHLYSWVFTGYMLAATITTPIAGRLGDLKGRKQALLTGIAVFLMGSVLAGLASNMPMLIGGRVVQGMGAGTMTSNAFAMVGDMVAPSKRGRYTGLFAAVHALASIVGPLLGGAIAETIGWRGVFFLNVPFSIAVGAIILVRLHLPARESSRLSIDWAGAAAFIVACVSLLMALPTSSEDGPIDALRWPLIALAIVAASIFFAIERRTAAPIIAFAIFRRPIFSLAVAVTFLYGASLHSMGVFVPLLLQGVLGQTPTRSGVFFLPMVLALVVGSIVGGQLVTRLGKYRWTATTGLIMAAVGTYALSRVDAGSSPNTLMPRLALIGFGIGIALPALSLAAQNAVAQRDVGACSSLMQFSRMLGGSIGVAILGALLSSSLHQGLVSALSRVLFTAAIILFVAVAVSVLIADVPLRQTVENEKDDSA